MIFFQIVMLFLLLFAAVCAFIEFRSGNMMRGAGFTLLALSFFFSGMLSIVLSIVGIILFIKGKNHSPRNAPRPPEDPHDQ